MTRSVEIRLAIVELTASPREPRHVPSEGAQLHLPGSSSCSDSTMLKAGLELDRSGLAGVGLGGGLGGIGPGL